MEKLKKIYEFMKPIKDITNKIKSILKTTFHSIIIILAMGACFALGYYFNKLKSYSVKEMPEHVKRSDVTIAIDENSNFMIIRKSDGSYKLYDDSIGLAIFDIYAKAIWFKTQQKQESTASPTNSNNTKSNTTNKAK